MKQYYLPRKLETNFMFYRVRKVEDAHEHWSKLKAEINKMFYDVNRCGLPAGYELEADPNHWNWYDLAVVAYYWWATEGPKMAHRGRRYPGTMTEIATKIFQAGGNRRSLLLQGREIDWAPIYDAFEWEAFFRQNGLYVKAMWEEEGWDGPDLWQAIADDRVYLCFLHQLDVRRLLRDDEGNEMTLDRQNDIGVAMMPIGASLELNGGEPVRKGRHASQISGWWWGIPDSVTPENKERSLKVLLEHIFTEDPATSTRDSLLSFHEAEVENFGILPVTKEVINRHQARYGDQGENISIKRNEGVEWRERLLRKVWEVSWAQIEDAEKTQNWLPYHRRWPAIQNRWLDAWYKVVRESTTPSREEVKKALSELRSEINKILEEKLTPVSMSPHGDRT
jgi:hypothetical protein